jgi:hypothetical protein
VVCRASDAQGRESNYYGIIQKILEFTFIGDKELKLFFFVCDWFEPFRGVRENHYGMVEVKHSETLRGNDNWVLAHQVEQVYYLPYPNKKFHAWWVVHKVIPREQLRTPCDAGYHSTQIDGEVDEVYQEEELPTSFVIEPGAGLDSLVGDCDNITVPNKRKRQAPKKRVRWSGLGRRGQHNRDVDEF